MNGPIDCTVFDEHVDDLALGAAEEPLRSRLLAHAASCPTCRAALDELGAVADGLLLAAPEVEPPPGFESRVLARIAPPAEHAPRHRWLAVAAAAVLLIGSIAAIVALRSDDGDAPISAAIVGKDATEVGAVQLVAAPQPHVLVVIERPQPVPGTRHCELQQADGTWVEVGTWTVSDLRNGVWAAGIDAALLDAVAMRVTADDGTVLATARF